MSAHRERIEESRRSLNENFRNMQQAVGMFEGLKDRSWIALAPGNVPDPNWGPNRIPRFPGSAELMRKLIGVATEVKAIASLEKRLRAHGINRP